jgi:hypothetical protein
VVAYSITTTSRFFRPKIYVGSQLSSRRYKIRLGRTCFSEISQNPAKWACWLGARRYGYIEEHYFGNPGGYQTWHCGVSDVGYQKHSALPFDGSGRDLSSEAEQFRSRSSINSIVIAGMTAPDLQLMETGPPLDQVRLLHPPNLRDRLRGWRMKRQLAKIKVS